MSVGANHGRGDGASEQQSLLRDLEGLVQSNPVASRQAAARLVRALSDSEMWAAHKDEYEKALRRGTSSAAPPRPEDLLSPQTDGLRPYWLLFNVARDLFLADEPTGQRPTIELSWDRVFVLWVLVTPGAPLGEFGLNPILQWDGNNGWNRQNILKDEFADQALRARILSRAASAVEEIRLARNPLLAAVLDPRTRPPEIQHLFDALVMVLVASGYLAGVYTQVIELWGLGGGPKPEDFPEREEERRREAQRLIDTEREAALQRGEDPNEIWIAVPPSRWADLIPKFKAAYRDWCERLAEALAAVPGVATAMNGTETRHGDKWTTKCTAELRALAGLLHPTILGEDGMGIARARPRPLPEEFADLLRAIAARKTVLHDKFDNEPPKTPNQAAAPVLGLISVGRVLEQAGISKGGREAARKCLERARKEPRWVDTLAKKQPNPKRGEPKYLYDFTVATQVLHLAGHIH